MVAVGSVGSNVTQGAQALSGSELQVQQYAQSNLNTGIAQNSNSVPQAMPATTTPLGNTSGDSILQSMQQTRQVDVINPQGLTSTERMGNATPVGTAYGASMGSPDNLGTSLNEVLESVHEKTTTYEQNGINNQNPTENTALSQERDSLKPTNPTLATEVQKPQTLNDQVNAQVDRYTDMMRNGYEYYIFTSLTIDVGKDVSQTASTLTKG
jgi:hypothetical protein